MWILCQQTILMKYHALFVIFENCRLLQIIGRALRAYIFQKLLLAWHFLYKQKMLLSRRRIPLATLLCEYFIHLT